MTLSRAQPRPRPAKANETPRRPFPALTCSTFPARTRDDPPGSLRPPRRCTKAARPRPSRPPARPRAGLSGASGAGGGGVSGFRSARVHGPRPRYLRPGRAEMPGAAPSWQPRRRRAGARSRPQSHAEPPTGPERPRAAAAGAPPGGGLPARRLGLLEGEDKLREFSPIWVQEYFAFFTPFSICTCTHSAK